MRGTPREVADRLRAAPVLAAAAAGLREAGIEAWAVGGSVRDVALGLEPDDFDIAVSGDPAAAAGAVAAAADAHRFELSAGFGTWRVLPHRAAVPEVGAWQIDITALRADGGIGADLAERDFTIGAIAVPLAGGDPVDPFGGLDDLVKRRLRAVSDHAFSADPLRLMRAPRIAAGLGLEPDERTISLARRDASRAADPSPERLLEELRLLVSGRDPERGLELANELGVLAPVLPELAALRGVGQGPNHHLDVYDHTMEVLRGVLEIEREPDRLFGSSAEEITALLAEPLADGFNRAGALRMGALFHDAGKPASRIEHEGMVGFPGHDETGAAQIDNLAARLRFSRRLRRHLRDLALHHLRLGFLVHHMPLSRRDIYGYLMATGDVAADVTLLTVADRLAARGTSGLASDEMVAAHLDLAAQMVAEALELRRDGQPEPLLRGDELAAELGVRPGPELADLLAELAAAQFAGEVKDRDQAIAHLRKFAAGF